MNITQVILFLIAALCIVGAVGKIIADWKERKQ